MFINFKKLITCSFYFLLELINAVIDMLDMLNILKQTFGSEHIWNGEVDIFLIVKNFVDGLLECKILSWIVSPYNGVSFLTARFLKSSFSITLSIAFLSF